MLPRTRAAAYDRLLQWPFSRASASMKKLIASLVCLFSLCPLAAAIDLTGLAAIEPVASYTSTRDTVTIACGRARV